MRHKALWRIGTAHLASARSPSMSTTLSGQKPVLLTDVQELILLWPTGYEAPRGERALAGDAGVRRGRSEPQLSPAGTRPGHARGCSAALVTTLPLPVFQHGRFCKRMRRRRSLRGLQRFLTETDLYN